MALGVHDGGKGNIKKWDLWGPLVICMLLAILLSIWSPADQAATVFCAVFGIIWVGAAVVTLNAQLLEGRISFFQSVCVLGYCVFPLCFFKQKTAYEILRSDWSSDVCSSD
eukprot:COSAG01_NODE_44732_length_416_cov_0.671924_1_plen_110_part_01